jgi:hypothetical protein
MNPLNTLLPACQCQQHALGAVTDVVKLGGRTYSIDQLLDKVLVASGPIRVYDRPGGNVMFTVSSGQSVGKIYSFNRPSATNGGQFWLQFDHPTAKWPNGVPKAAWITSDSYVDTRVLETQGTQTLKQQMEAEKEKAERQEDPVSYYLKKFGLPVLLIAGGIYTSVQLGKTVIEKKL